MMLERFLRMTVLALFVSVAASAPGCAALSLSSEGARDASGAQEEEALAQSMQEQYQHAAEHYTELNEHLAALQLDFFDDEWLDGSVSSEVIPGQGYTRGGDLVGDDHENSYYFMATRWHPADEDLQALIHRVAAVWTDRGWNVTEETTQNGTARVVAITEEGFWFIADEMRNELELSALSPVYWGDRRGLSRATALRRDTEDDAGAPWDTTDRDANGSAYRLPGVFRPFPEWDAMTDAEP